MSVASEYQATTADVNAWRIAKVYAEALFRAGEKHNQTEALLEELDSLIKDVFRASPDLENFLANRSIGREAKAPVIDKVLQGRANPMLIDFLQVLNRHERLDLLREIAASFRELGDQKAKRVRVTVKTAVALPDDQRERLLAQLRENMRQEPVLELQVDPSLLGGMVVQAGDWLFDSSVRSRLDSLRNQLIERSSHEIQSRRDHFSSDGRD